MRGRALAALGGIVAALAPGPGLPRASADDTALGIADLAAYRAALTDRPGSTPEGLPVAVGFRELWNHPEAYQGRRVQVQGGVVRRFRQGAFGTFPPLTEVWAISPAGDPYCLVYPEPPARSTPEPIGTVRFVGTFLKRLRYQGGDGPRLVPLVVGPRPPAALERAPSMAPNSSRSFPWLDWTIGLVAATSVALVLAWQHLRRPSRRPINLDVGPPPVFDDEP